MYEFHGVPVVCIPEHEYVAERAVVSAAIEWHYADEDDANAVRGGALRYSRAMVALHERVRALLSLREGT